MNPRSLVKGGLLSSGGGGSGLKTPLDLFIIVGQSNAEGRGDSALSPPAPYGKYVNGSSIGTLADPVGGALTGSMWPAMANEWFLLTGKRAAFVEAATGSTRLLDYGVPADTWAPGGNLRAPAAALGAAAVATINASDLYSLGNVYFVWAQGEGDAENFDGSHTAAQYKTALEALATYFKAQVPEMVTMLVIRSASNINDATKDAGYFACRQAQEDACTSSALLVMGYRGTYSFRPLAYMADSVHYNQTGLNLAGKCAARGLNSPESFVATTAIPAPNAYTDTDYNTTATTKTQAHTTAADTKTLVVAAAGTRPGSTTTFVTVSVTFNGVAMTQVREQADNGTSGRAVSAIYMLDETTYGASLNSVTADIVVTYTTAVPANLIEVAAFNSPDALFIDYANSANASGDQSALALDYYTGGPALTVVCACSAGAGTVAATCVISGSTEVLDAGGSNGTTRTGQACISYVQDAAAVSRTYTATFSALQNAIALVVASFRKKWNGE